MYALDQLERHLDGRGGPVTRLELKLFPPVGLAVSAAVDAGRPDRIRAMRYRIAEKAGIDQSARAIMTRDGVWLWPLKNRLWMSAGYRYRPHPVSGGGTYTLVEPDDDGQRLLILHDDDLSEVFAIRQFNVGRLQKGGRFVADRLAPDTAAVKLPSRQLISGRLLSINRDQEGMTLSLTGSISGRYVLRPILLDARRRYLFYRLLS